MCLLRSALISFFCKYWPACFILITPLRAPVYHYLLWFVSPAMLINIILAYFENVGMCVICCKPALSLFFLSDPKFKAIVSPAAAVPFSCCSSSASASLLGASETCCIWLNISRKRSFCEGLNGGNVWLAGLLPCGAFEGALVVQTRDKSCFLCPVVSSGFPHCQPRLWDTFMLLSRPLWLGAH